MKKLFIFLLLATLFCGLCVVGLAAEQPSAEELLKQVPDYAHTGNKETILSVSGPMEAPYSVVKIFFDRLYQDGLVQDGIKSTISVEDVCKTYERLFGPGTSSTLGIENMKDGAMFGTGSEALHLQKDTQTFTYDPETYGGGVHFGTRRTVVRSETVGQDVIVYARFAQFNPGGDWVLWVKGSVSSDNALIELDQQEKKALPEYINPWGMISKGAFDEYLPVYKHTFKPNGDGTYYWAQTELDTAGKEIPLSVFEEEEKYLQSLVATVPKEAYRGSVTNSNYQSHSKLTYSRLLEDKLYVSESYAEWILDGTSLVLYSPRGNGKTGGQITLGTWENVSPDTNLASIEGLIRDEKFVQYYTNYRHTFKENEDGTYSWVETTVDQYGQEMPSALTGGSSNKNTDSTTNTSTDTVSDVSDSDVVTDTVTDTSDTVLEASTDTVTEGTGSEIVTDGSTGATSDVGGVEESTSYTWIYVTVGAVVIVAAVAVFLVLKKKKA